MKAGEADLLVAWATLSSLVLGVLLMMITGDSMYILLCWVVRILMGFLIPRKGSMRDPRKYPSLRFRLWGLARSSSLLVALVAVVWWSVEMVEILLEPFSALMMAGMVLLVMATWFLPGLAEEEFNGLGGAKLALVVMATLGVFAKALDIIEPFEMLKSFVLSNMVVMVPVVLLFISPVIVQLLLFGDADKEEKMQLDEDEIEEENNHHLNESDHDADDDDDNNKNSSEDDCNEDEDNILEEIASEKDLEEIFKLIQEKNMNEKLSEASLFGRRKRMMTTSF
ncbi:unnamed protein product [Meganyctiphanes norvegica]|uniref:Uncharacterized protein n=1 Tax=Meganyctiphanes norvegica TaxID=48144 RepID=A0AAV2R1C4_MEGNR